jgi:uncharacterized protein (TIGR00251 family)
VKFSSYDLFVIQGNEISVSIKSAPERGKANAELVKKLSRYFGVDPSRIRIVSGLISRNKIVEII